MVAQKKEEVKQLLQQSEKLTTQIENLYNEFTVIATAINNEIIQINTARSKLLFAKQSMMKLLQRI